MKSGIYFGTTRSGSSYYDLLNEGLKLDAEKKLKKNLKLHYIKKKFPSISFFFFFFVTIFTLKFLDARKYILLKYKECHIGRYAHSHSMRNKYAFRNKFFLFFLRLKSLFLAGAIVDTGFKITNKIDAAYFDHGVYLNGLYIEIFLKKKKLVYTNSVPKGMVCSNFKGNNNGLFLNEDLIKIKKKKNFKILNNKKNKEFVKKKINNPASFNYMRLVNFKNKTKGINFKDIDYIIFHQGSSDAQLIYGYTGFPTVNEWMEYVLDNLIKNNKSAVIKPHPQTYDIFQLEKRNDIDQKIKELVEIDYLVYLRLKKKYSRYKNLIFLNNAISNDYLFKILDKKKHILIMFHTKAILEAAYNGFKIISSSALPWSNNFKISNTFNSSFELRKILNKKFKQLKYSNNRDLVEVTNQFYLNPYGIFGKKFITGFFEKFISKKMILKFGYEKKFHNTLEKKPFLKKKIIFHITKSIEQL